jgi:hypothetical protein
VWPLSKRHMLNSHARGTADETEKTRGLGQSLCSTWRGRRSSLVGARTCPCTPREATGPKESSRIGISFRNSSVLRRPVRTPLIRTCEQTASKTCTECRRIGPRRRQCLHRRFHQGYYLDRCPGRSTENPQSRLRHSLFHRSQPRLYPGQSLATSVIHPIPPLILTCPNRIDRIV